MADRKALSYHNQINHLSCPTIRIVTTDLFRDFGVKPNPDRKPPDIKKKNAASLRTEGGVNSTNNQPLNIMFEIGYQFLADCSRLIGCFNCFALSFGGRAHV